MSDVSEPPADLTAAPPELESTLSRLRGALSRASVERTLTRAAAVFGLLLSLQAVPGVSSSAGYVDAPWLPVVPVVLFGVLALVVIAAIAQRGVHIMMVVFAALYFIAFALWPLSVSNSAAAVGTQPWLWSLIAVAMAYVAIGLPEVWAGMYIVAVTALYVGIHLTPAGGSGTLKGGLLDAVYVLLIGAFMLVLVSTLRRAASRVDAAQATAMQQYARAARNYAAEVERGKIDALVHDSVLTTLITAARAETPAERTAAAELAAEALETLRQAPVAFDPQADVTQIEFAERLTAAVQVLSPRVDVTTQALSSRRIPAGVADALFAAAVQAVINSLQHAGDADGTDDVRRTVGVTADGGQLTVHVSDTGVGFDLESIPPPRLGLRVSIRERVESVGGRAQVSSTIGGGTSVVLTWSQPGMIV